MQKTNMELKEELLDMIHRRRLYTAAYHLLDKHKDRWIKSGYGYKGAELCTELLHRYKLPSKLVCVLFGLRQEYADGHARYHAAAGRTPKDLGLTPPIIMRHRPKK